MRERVNVTEFSHWHGMGYREPLIHDGVFALGMHAVLLRSGVMPAHPGVYVLDIFGPHSMQVGPEEDLPSLEDIRANSPSSEYDRVLLSLLETGNVLATSRLSQTAHIGKVATVHPEGAHRVSMENFPFTAMNDRLYLNHEHRLELIRRYTGLGMIMLTRQGEIDRTIGEFLNGASTSAMPNTQ